MGLGKPVATNGGEHHRGFEGIADTILYRWSVERDTWVSPSEIEHARAYLTRHGIAISPRVRSAYGPGPASRMTRMISSTVGGSAGKRRPLFGGAHRAQ